MLLSLVFVSGAGLLILGGALGGTVSVYNYVPRTVVHAETPLTTPVVTPSAVMCAALCVRAEGCLKWSRRREGPEAGLCRLWPVHSAANPLTAAAEPLHQYRMPPGYSTASADRRLAFRGHQTPTAGGRGLIDRCREDDPESVPAFPTSDEQLGDLLGMQFSQLWISINDIRAEGVFEDLFHERTVAVPPEWYQHIPNNMFGSDDSDCVLIVTTGIIARPCSRMLGYLCQYRM